MEKFFKLKANNTTVRTEVIAGLTTFFTMAYIIFVNPNMLSITGMPWGAVFVATILASVIGTLIMGLLANVPYAQAPGMGLNAFFTFTVCGQMGFSWQEALALVFFCGLLNIFITVTKFRKSIIRSIPSFLQNAISGGIGLFIAYIGVKNAGLLSFTADPGTYVQYGEGGAVIANSSIVPGLVNFNSPGPILALIGLAITVVLLVKQVKGAIFISIILTTLIGIPMGVVSLQNVSLFDLSAIADIKDTAFVLFGSEGMGNLFTNFDKVLLTLVAVFAFSLTDTFDTIGTFVGTGRISGIFDEADEEAVLTNKGFGSKMERALFADAFATTTGAMLGTSNVTTYVESASGISVGGRTGLTSVVIAGMFLLCLPFAGLFGIVPAEATASALIVVGVMMMSSFGKIKWDDFSQATPAFLTATFMTFAYNISYGIAAGFLFYCIIKAVKGQAKEIHPIIIGATALFLLNFIIIAIG